MASPFLGEIRVMSFNFAPKTWAQCNGQLLPINQNQALFSLLGTMYGGNGTTNFALPDLRCHVPMHFGGGHAQGERAGQDFHTVTAQELPMHTHVVSAQSGLASTNLPATNTTLAQSTAANLYGPATNLTPMHPAALDSTGSSQPHENRQPFLTLNFCIALQGIFPSRS